MCKKFPSYNLVTIITKILCQFQCFLIYIFCVLNSLIYHHFTHTAHLIFSIMFCASSFSLSNKFSDIGSKPSTILAGRSTSQFPQYLTLCKRTTSSGYHQNDSALLREKCSDNLLCFIFRYIYYILFRFSRICIR